MDFYFQSGSGTVQDGKLVLKGEATAALFRALDHMTAGSTHGRHNIACRKCWDKYMELKRVFEGG